MISTNFSAATIQKIRHMFKVLGKYNFTSSIAWHDMNNMNSAKLLEKSLKHFSLFLFLALSRLTRTKLKKKSELGIWL
jgi:hypothetical protein